ncbi:MAG TPA: DUF4136 domain-containing protein [Silvibacterium sp.]|nr:DUF4136 domain-containing protein [Silvibacterium sp.]
MRYALHVSAAAVVLFFTSAVAAFAGNVRTDYDHGVNFAQYHTYSWGKVQTSDPFFVDRVKQAVDKELQAKGWQLLPSGGSVTVMATDNVHNQKEVQTVYDGWGGGWGGGWGWGGWGWGGWAGPGGFGDATTTTTNQPVAHLVVDLFDSGSKNLLWRGLATEDLSSNANRNTKSLDSDVGKMFKDFPPKPGH